ncbi:unnamed protein product [Rhizophagus irregularis]|nr:unnamed protein product [Rhizophagus irregularis]
MVQINYGKLVEMGQNKRHMGANPVIVGSHPPPEDTLWNSLRRLGYNVTVHDQNFLNEKKEVNLEMVRNILRTVYRNVTEIYVKHLQYKPAIESRTTIMNLDDYYKKFMFACEHPDIARVKHLEIFTDIVKDSDIMEYYIELDLFGWWHKQNENSLKLYVNNYTQWENLKNLILHKYPSAREIKRDIFCLEKDTFFKMYSSFLNRKG